MLESITRLKPYIYLYVSSTELSVLLVYQVSHLGKTVKTVNTCAHNSRVPIMSKL